MPNTQIITPPLISIIVPVYNVENYVQQCFDSVISQSFKDWEMIIIDDGSTDNSGCICDKYASIEPRIKVVHQKNGGLSVARNKGISLAQGVYLFFLDSDDYLPEDSLSNLATAAKTHKWPIYIKGNHSVLMPNQRLVTTRFAIHRKEYDNKPIDISTFLLDIILPHPLVWNGLIKRQIFKEHNLQFIPDAWPREDLVFHLEASSSKLKGRAVYISKETYIYRYGVANSLSNTISLKSVKNHIYISKAIFNCIHNISDPFIRDLAQKEFVGTINSFFRLLPRTNLTFRNEYINEYHKHLGLKLSKMILRQAQPLTRIYYFSNVAYRIACLVIHCIIPRSKRIT